MLWKIGAHILPYFYRIDKERKDLVRKGLSKLFIAFVSKIKIQKKLEHKPNLLPDPKPQQFYFNYLHFCEFRLTDNIVFPTILQYYSFQPYSTSLQIKLSPLYGLRPFSSSSSKPKYWFPVLFMNVLLLSRFSSTKNFT